EDLALEHGGGHVERERWDELLVEALLLELAAGGVVRSERAGPPPAGCRAAVATLERNGTLLARDIEAEAQHLITDGIPRLRADVTTRALATPDLVPCVEQRRHEDVPGVVGLVWVQEWLLAVADHVPRLPDGGDEE